MHDLPSHVSLFPHKLDARSYSAVSAALSYGEFLQRYPSMAELLHARRQEIRISAEDQLYFTEFPTEVRLLAVAEPASVNTAIALPILARIAEMMVHGSLWVVVPESGQEIAQQLVPERCDGGEWVSSQLPVLIALDGHGGVLAEWGPHPLEMSDYLGAWLEENNVLPSDSGGDAYLTLNGSSANLANRLLHDMRIWYNSGLSAACVSEVRAALNGIARTSSTEIDALAGNVMVTAPGDDEYGDDEFDDNEFDDDDGYDGGDYDEDDDDDEEEDEDDQEDDDTGE